MGLSDRLKSMDAHSSVSSEFRVYTMQGAILSVMTVSAIVYLVFAEVGYNFTKIITEKVHVNATSPRGLDVEFDISLPQVPCSLLSIDANDPTGQSQSLHLDRKHHVWKHRIELTDKGKIKFKGRRNKLELGSTLLKEEYLKEAMDKLADGEEPTEAEEVEEEEEACGSCYGAGEEDECCNSCDDVKRAYNRKGWQTGDLNNIKQCARELKGKSQDGDEGEGCNVHGVIALDTGGGNFHLAPGRGNDNAGDASQINNILEMLMRTFEQWNVSHTVHKIRFGDSYPGHINQLDGESRSIGDSYGMYQYYFKIVPTRYKFLNGTVIETNQYSVTEHLRHVNPGGGRGLPGVFFFYEISPLHVEITESYRKGWIAFFTSVCAIVGGVVTIMGMIDQFLHSRQASHHNDVGLLR